MAHAVSRLAFGHRGALDLEDVQIKTIGGYTQDIQMCCVLSRRRSILLRYVSGYAVETRVTEAFSGPTRVARTYSAGGLALGTDRLEAPSIAHSASPPQNGPLDPYLSRKRLLRRSRRAYDTGAVAPPPRTPPHRACRCGGGSVMLSTDEATPVACAMLHRHPAATAPSLAALSSDHVEPKLVLRVARRRAYGHLIHVAPDDRMTA